MADPLCGRQVLMPSMTHTPPMTHAPPVTHSPPMTNSPPKAQPPAVQQSHDQSLTPPDSPTKQLYEVWAVPPQAVVQQMHEQAVTPYVAPTQGKPKWSTLPTSNAVSRPATRQERRERSSSLRPPVWAVPPQAVIEQQAAQESRDQSLSPSAEPTQPEPQFLATEAVRALMSQPPPSLQPPVVQQSHYQSLTPSPVPTQAVPATLAQAGLVQYGGQAPAQQHMTYPPPVTQPSVVQQSHYQSLTPSPVPTQSVPQVSATQAVAGSVQYGGQAPSQHHMTHPLPVTQASVVQQSHYQSLTPSPVPTQAVPATLAQAVAGPVLYDGQAPAQHHMTHPPPVTQPSVVQQSHYQSLTPAVPTQAVSQVSAKRAVAGRVVYDSKAPAQHHMTHRPPVTQPSVVQQSHYQSLTPAVPTQAVSQVSASHAGPVLYGGQAPAGQHMTQASVVQQSHYQSLTPSPVPTQAVPATLAQAAQAGQHMTYPPPVTQASVVQQSHYQSLTPSPVPTQAEPATLTQAVVEKGPVLYGCPALAPAQQHMAHPPPVAQPSVAQQSHYQSLTPSPVPTQSVPQEPATLAQAGVAAEFIELNSYNAANFVAQYGDILLAGNPTQWHKITINTPVLERERKFVILAINKQLRPMKLIPYFFRMENNRITFHVNLCGVALKALCRQDLKVPCISGKYFEIEMTLGLFSKHFNISETMEKIVSRRLDTQGKFLDLSDINSIPEVQEMLFDPTDNWHILEQLLRVAQVMVPELATLGLAGNGIVESVSFWELLASSKWLSLRTLDLSDNEIGSTCEMSLPRPWAISELYLDRNPICRIHNRNDYVSAARVTFPLLTKLDGTYPHTTAGVPDWKPNFIVASTRDSGEFADQFIEHFFTLYDGADRKKQLHGLYHKRACFSMKFPFYTGSRMNYGEKTRNLLHGFNKKEARAALTLGSERILRRLSNLPKTQHDPYSFSVDLTVHMPKLTVLTVTGVFRDFTKDKRTHRHFSRTFVLTGRGNGEYQITNDILFISNATDRETQEAFKFVRPPKEKKYRPMSNLSDFDKEYMIIQVQHVTNMSAQWSRKCLEDTNWDLKEALEIFLELHKTRKIPKSAFSQLETVNRNRPRF